MRANVQRMKGNEASVFSLMESRLTVLFLGSIMGPKLVCAVRMGLVRDGSIIRRCMLAS